MKIDYSLFVVLIALAFMQCKPTNTQSAKKTTFLALGDSYTIGQSVEEEGRWPNQLVRNLNAEGFDIKSPKIIAKTGWRTDDLLNAIDNRLKEDDTYDVVSVAIGVNNQFQKRSIVEYEKQLNTVFQKAILHSKRGAKGVFAVNIPDYGSSTMFSFRDNEAIGKEVDKFNVVFKRVANNYKVAVYDVNAISKEVANKRDMFAVDELHPSAKQYTLWVEKIQPFVSSMFK